MRYFSRNSGLIITIRSILLKKVVSLRENDVFVLLCLQSLKKIRETNPTKLKIESCLKKCYKQNSIMLIKVKLHHSIILYQINF